MGGPMQNLDLYNIENLANQTFLVVWQKLFFFQNSIQDNYC